MKYCYQWNHHNHDPCWYFHPLKWSRYSRSSMSLIYVNDEKKLQISRFSNGLTYNGCVSLWIAISNVVLNFVTNQCVQSWNRNLSIFKISSAYIRTKFSYFLFTQVSSDYNINICMYIQVTHSSYIFQENQTETVLWIICIKVAQ